MGISRITDAAVTAMCLALGLLGGAEGAEPGVVGVRQLRFPEGNTLKAYAQQLDGVGIHLGALVSDPDGGDNVVEYAYNLSHPSPTVERRPAREEERYYFTWHPGSPGAEGHRLIDFDKQLLKKAGIPSRGKVLIILKLLPAEVEKQMVKMERERAVNAGKDPGSVRCTVFEIRQQAGDYKLAIQDQRYTSEH